MVDYFHRDEEDARFYEEHIAPRLPERLIDAHMHMNLPEHVAGVSPQTVAGDWALQCGLVMPWEDAAAYHGALFSGRPMGMVAMPWPLPEADIPANNAYLSGLQGQGRVTALMTTRPQWPAEAVEAELLRGGYAGLKPYPYMAAAEKGAEVSIYDFLPPAHLDVADRHGKAVLLHLPRRGRLADDDNVRELRDIVHRWPRVKLVVAHLGRSFNPVYLREGLRKLGGDAAALWFDTAAVSNPAVYAEAFSRLDTRRVLFGTDMPILLWHGRRRWDETHYYNLCREDFPWNTHREPEAEAGYTFYIYEQIRATLDALTGAPIGAVTDIFHNNARRVYGASC